MPALTRAPSSTMSTKSSSKSSKSSKSTSTRASHGTRSTESYESTSSNATTIANSIQGSHVRTAKPSSPSTKPLVHQQQTHVKPQPVVYEEWSDSPDYEDLSPGTCVHPRDSVDTYASTNPSQDNLADEEDDVDSQRSSSIDEIPPLPIYRHEIVEPNVRPTTPNEFARLFPSLNRLSIRHDEFTSDGNMNLRVDVPVHSSRRRGAAQLFHLRMYDLARREFSLRRYCRDSGREVCNSKRKYASPAASASSKKDGREAAASDSSCDTCSTTPPAEKRQEAGRPSLPRAMTSAIKTFSSRPQSKRTQTCPAAAVACSKRPGSSGSSSSSDHEPHLWGAAAKKTPAPAPPAIPTNTIKLEFSNYARVDIERRGKSSSDSKRYDFEWWGHKYSWRRTMDKHTGAVSFHLMRDGGAAKKKGDSISTAVAHIVPETRSPIQVADDDEAGGWVPPCHMWINDESVLDAMTDVADVIVATGLIALVDDCIKERWQTPKVHRIPLMSRTLSLNSVGPKAFMRQVFGRRNSAGSTSPSKPSPLSTHEERYGKHDGGYGHNVYEHEYQQYNAGRHRHAVAAY